MAVNTGITNEDSWWSAVGWKYHWYKVNENKEGESDQINSHIYIYIYIYMREVSLSSVFFSQEDLKI